MKKRLFCISILVLLVGISGCSPEIMSSKCDKKSDIFKLPIVSPESQGFDSKKLCELDYLIADLVDSASIPGACLIVGRNGYIVKAGAYGWQELEPQKIPMTIDTLFDLASVTKPIGPGSAILKLLDQNKISLDDPVSKYIPEFAEEGKPVVTVRDLATHTSSLPAGINIWKLNEELGPEPNPVETLKAMCRTPLRGKPGKKYIYSDINYTLLARVAEVACGMNLETYLKKEVYEPLDMFNTGVRLTDEQKAKCAPTSGAGEFIRGYVHDPTARFYCTKDYTPGNAGLFSTVSDLANYGSMIANGGLWKGKRILSERAIELMTTPQTKTADRSIGWGAWKGDNGHNYISHLGWTGTYMIVDVDTGSFMVYLTNRTHTHNDGFYRIINSGKMVDLWSESLLPTSE